MALTWRGKEVERKMIAAIKNGVNQTMSEAAEHAKNNHPGWQSKTGITERSIRPVVPARERGNEVVGIWGVANVRHPFSKVTTGEIGIFLEFGTKNPDGTVRMEAKPFLRPAADAIYPRLAGNIRGEFKTKVKRIKVRLRSGAEITAFKRI